MGKVGIIMGSFSDFPVMKKAVEVLRSCGIQYEVKIVSAHRTPDKMYEYAKTAEKRNISVIIAGAGGAAHLPGMVAALTHLPVIGVPVESKALKGLDSLLSIAQMPKGIPVATVSVNNAGGAGLYAAQIIAISDQAMQRRIEKYKKSKQFSPQG